MTPEERNAQMLQKALDGHQATDDTGAISENEYFEEESAPQEQTTDTDTESSEKSAETLESAPKAEEDDSENELAEDESGKRYVPQSRFDKMYGKQKALERELEAFKKQALQSETTDVNAMFPVPQVQTQSQPNDFESEYFFDKYPQFNPESTEYSQALDHIGWTIAQAKPNLSKLAIAKEALKVSKELTANQAEVVAQSRQVKQSQSDQGVTSRVTSRIKAEPDINKMSLDEQEAYLKSTGQWDSF